MKRQTLPIVALLAAVLTLAACGGGSGPPDDPNGSGSPVDPGDPDPPEDPNGSGPPDDPGTVRLDKLLNRSDALLFSSVVSRWSLAAEGETVGETVIEGMTCAGARCVGDDGERLHAD